MEKNKKIVIKDFVKKYKFLILLLLLVISVVPYAYAKYISSIKGKATVSVDKVYYSITTPAPTDVDLENNTATYYFNVNNYDATETLNQVLMKYYLLIQIPPKDASTDCENRKDLCSNSAYEEILKAECPVTCGYTEGIDNVTFSKKLYYKDLSNNWNEISINTSGAYNGYYTGFSNLIFTNKEVHEYKFVLSTTDNIIFAKNYPFTVNVKFVQTQS